MTVKTFIANPNGVSIEQDAIIYGDYTPLGRLQYVQLATSPNLTPYISTDAASKPGLVRWVINTTAPVQGPSWVNFSIQNYDPGPFANNIVYPQDFGAVGDGVTDDTAAIQAAIDACSANGGGVVFLPGGTYVVDLNTTSGTVTYALYHSSNVSIDGPGVLQLASNTSRQPSTNTLTVMYANGESDIGFTGAIDGNRANQGPYAYGPISSASGPENFAVRSHYYLDCTNVRVPHLDISNLSGQGCFIEGSSSEVAIGSVLSTNNLCAVCFDSGTNVGIESLIASNSDPALTVNTTTTDAITGGSVATVTPASMAGIEVGSVLSIASNSERVLVTSVTATTFTAYFANTYSGTTTIETASFASDSALQFGPGVSNATFGEAIINYSNALAVYGSGVEIFGCSGVSGGHIVTNGCWRPLWIHNWTINGTIFDVQNIAIATVVAINPQTSATGLGPVGIFIDDNGNTAANPVRNVSVGNAIVRYGYNGAALPAGYAYVDMSTNVVNSRVRAITDNGTTLGTYVFPAVQTVSLAANITPATATPTNILSLALQPGTYKITAHCSMYDNASEIVTATVQLSTTSATLPGAAAIASTEVSLGLDAGASENVSIALSGMITLDTDTTIYMVTQNGSGHPVVVASGTSYGGGNATVLTAEPQ